MPGMIASGVTVTNIDFSNRCDLGKSMFHIRRTDDMQAIHELDRATFPGDKPTLERESTHVWWVAEDRTGAAVAFIGLGTGVKNASISRVGVLPAYRGHGLQKRLVRTAIRYARKQGFKFLLTYVLASNIPSLRALLACGFKPHRATRTTPMFIHLHMRLDPRVTQRV